MSSWLCVVSGHGSPVTIVLNFPLFFSSLPFSPEVGYIWCGVVYNPVSGN